MASLWFKLWTNKYYNVVSNARLARSRNNEINWLKLIIEMILEQLNQSHNKLNGVAKKMKKLAKCYGKGVWSNLNLYTISVYEFL